MNLTQNSNNININSFNYSKNCSSYIHKNKKYINKNYLSFWYTNATSLDNKMHLFELELLTEDPDIAVVTETWFRESSLVNVNGYTLF